MEELLIAEVAKYPWLYEENHDDYTNMPKRKDTWEVVQQALELPVDDGEYLTAFCNSAS